MPPPMEDVKPVLSPSPPPPAVIEEPPRMPVCFPRTLQNSFVDSSETKHHVDEFLGECVTLLSASTPIERTVLILDSE